MSASLAAAVVAAALAADAAIQPDWMVQDAEQKVVTLKIVGSMNHANGTMNFNGYGNGEMTVTVPLGWMVKVEFSNGGYGALPHSLAIIDPKKRPKLQGGDPAFPAATTIKLVQGMIPGETDTFEFTADKAGRFLFWCGVPSHGQNGMWTNLVISRGARAAQVTVKKKKETAEATGGTDGTHWAGLGEEEKLALLRRFLAGAASGEEGRFAFAPEVYKARLEDLYFYRDQRALPLHEALRRIDAQIRTANRPPDPGR